MTDNELYSQGRENGTAMTNQASEDDLYSKLLNLRLTVWRQTNLNGQANLDHDSVEEVIALIRTEKLKLLAEVRERVVGVDEPGITNIMIAAEHAKQINALTKLEAEL